MQSNFSVETITNSETAYVTHDFPVKVPWFGMAAAFVSLCKLDTAQLAAYKVEIRW